MPFYAVTKGLYSGVFDSWEKCKEVTSGVSGSYFRKFDTFYDALSYVKQRMFTNNQHYVPTHNQWIGGLVFDVDDKKFVHVYIDGSCINNGQHNAKAGYGVYYRNNHELNCSSPVKGRATNNCGEILAAAEAIKSSSQHNVRKLCIHTDSMFLIDSVCKWMSTWKNNGWELANGSPVRNREEFELLDDIMICSDMIIKWNFVPSHEGIPGNEAADKLARAGAMNYYKIV